MTSDADRLQNIELENSRASSLEKKKYILNSAQISSCAITINGG